MRLRLPHTFTIILSLIILMAVLTWIMPAGKFDRKFDEATGREVVVAGTYHNVESNPQGYKDAFSAFARGIVDASEIIAYLLVIGGAYGVILKTGAINNGLKAVIKKMKGRENLLIPVLMILFSIAGTMAGLYEETLAFYLILIPLMVVSGYDPIVAVAVILVGVGTGFTASIGNPFAIGIASQLAQISVTDGMMPRILFYLISLVISITYVLWYANRIKKDPKKSIVYSLREDHLKHFGSLDNEKGHVNFGWNQKLIIVVLLSMMGLMMFSFLYLGWWFPEITMIFLTGAIIAGVLGKLNEKEFWDSFVEGSQSLLYAALVIGLTRGIVLVAQDGVIIDTVLNAIINFLGGLSKGAFIILNEVVQIVVAFFVPSSSAHAALTMPLMVPLADVFEIPRSSVITAYAAASGFINQFSPTAGVLMAAIGMARITWGHWLKFIMPLLGIQFILSIIILVFTI